MDIVQVPAIYWLMSVYTYETLNKEEKQIMEKMQESDNFKPNLSIKEKIFKKFKNFFD